MDFNIDEFKIYTDNYSYLGDPVILKIDHTFRVMKLCEEIAKSLNLNDEDIELAKLCGLLHDIGRFEQYKQFHTFKDLKSIDHGDLGYEILTEEDYIKKFIFNHSDENIVLNAVRFHNKLSIPNDLSERETLFLNITRDADKIDILYLFTNGHIEIDIDDTTFSEPIMDSMRNNLVTDKKLEKTKVDKLAVSLGFVFDINYPFSMKILNEKDYINEEINHYKEKSKSEKAKEQFEEIRNIITKYMEKRVKDVR